eukprot:SAG11_NODE_32637_length_282_cov_0.540984_1_plen_58_part_01
METAVGSDTRGGKMENAHALPHGLDELLDARLLWHGPAAAGSPQNSELIMRTDHVRTD